MRFDRRMAVSSVEPKAEPQASDCANRAPKIDARLSQQQQPPQSNLPAC